jgi:hypothetical protein
MPTRICGLGRIGGFNPVTNVPFSEALENNRENDPSERFQSQCRPKGKGRTIRPDDLPVPFASGLLHQAQTAWSRAQETRFLSLRHQFKERHGHEMAKI